MWYTLLHPCNDLLCYSMLEIVSVIIIIIFFNPSVLNSRGKKTKQGVNDCNGGLLGRKSA